MVTLAALASTLEADALLPRVLAAELSAVLGKKRQALTWLSSSSSKWHQEVQHSARPNLGEMSRLVAVIAEPIGASRACGSTNETRAMESDGERCAAGPLDLLGCPS